MQTLKEQLREQGRHFKIENKFIEEVFEKGMELSQRYPRIQAMMMIVKNKMLGEKKGESILK